MEDDKQIAVENPWTKVFEGMDASEAKAKEEYKRIMEEDKGKDWMDLFPPEFRKLNRSLLKRGILQEVEETTTFLNNCSLYEGRIFDKKEVVHYMIQGTKYNSFYLAEQFIPKRDSMDLWMEIKDEFFYKKSDEERKIIRDEFYEANKERFAVYANLNHQLSYLEQVWEQWEDRQKVKAGKLVDSWDMEKDGFPSTSRGALCYLFIPVKGEWSKDWAEGPQIALYNPRTKRNEVFTDLKYKAEDDIYSAVNEKGKTVFFTSYESVEDAWDALFSSNKEIYSGWWNKTMEVI